MMCLLRFAATVAIVVSLSQTHDLSADEPLDSANEAGVETQPDCEEDERPYCGIASMYGALQAIGVDVEFASLLQPQYVGSEEGSSAEELMRVARDRGVHVTALKGMTADLLRSLEHPVVLHVATPLALDPHQFDHWIVFLGTHAGKARIIDYPDAAEEVSFVELLSRWDGLGLIVSREPVSLLSSWQGQFTGFAAVVTLVATIGLLFRYPLLRIANAFANRIHAALPALIAIRCSAMLGTAAILGILYHSIDDDGMLSHRDECQAMAMAYFPATTARMSLQELVTGLKQRDVTIVDARHPQGYRQGCIPDAVNIPPSMSAARRARTLGHLKKDAQLVIYCESNGCPYSDNVARALVHDGYSNIQIFPGGWQEWIAQAVSADSEQ